MEQDIRFTMENTQSTPGEFGGITLATLGSKPFILVEFEKDENNDVDVEIVVGGPEVPLSKFQTLLGYVIQGLEENAPEDDED